ncbi:MAG: hypothetical protein JW900_14625 [Anaerolineae bacterium]|nr:hypothetical protein [Anaerolineae bacterium]
MGALVILLIPLLAAVLVYALRRWQNVAALIAISVSLGLGLILILVPVDQPLELFGREVLLGSGTALMGRELVFEAADRAALAFLMLTGAGFFLLSWRLEPQSLLLPVGSALLGLLGGVLLIRPLIYAGLLLQIAAALSLFPLHADPKTPIRGGLRYLTFFTLALPGVMVSHWLLDMYAINPDQTEYLAAAAALIGFSFALLLGVTPFHLWVPAVGRDGTPLASAFLFSAVGGTVWFLLLDYLQVYPGLSESPGWSATFTALGAITVLVGGLLGMTRRGAGTLMGYAIMVDTGLLLLTMSHPSRTSIGIGVMMIFARPWGAAVMAGGMTGLRARSNGAQAPDGLGLQAPWSTIALGVGALSLIGFPPTIGFVARWGAWRLLFEAEPAIALVLLLASMGPLVGLLRLLHQLLTPPGKTIGLGKQEKDPPPPLPPEPQVVTLLFLLFALGILALGLFPQGLAALAARVASSFAILP